MSLLPGQIDSFGSCKNTADAEDVLESLGHLEDAGPHASRWNIKVYDAIHSLVANRADFGALWKDHYHQLLQVHNSVREFQ